MEEDAHFLPTSHDHDVDQDQNSTPTTRTTSVPDQTELLLVFPPRPQAPPIVNININLGKNIHQSHLDVSLVSRYEELLQTDRHHLCTSKKRKHNNNDDDHNNVPLVPNWNLSLNSSIFDDYSHTPFDLYTACLLPRDKAKLTSIPYPDQLEQFGAQNLMQLAICMHQLSLTCSYWKHSAQQTNHHWAKSIARVARLEAEFQQEGQASSSSNYNMVIKDHHHVVPSHPTMVMMNPARPNLAKGNTIPHVNRHETLHQTDPTHELVDDHKLKLKQPFIFDATIPWAPNWNVSADSSILESDVGDASFELYKACLLPRDKAKFVHTKHPQVEEYGAHYLMQAMLCMHELSLRCSNRGNPMEGKSMELIKKLEADLCKAKETSKKLEDVVAHYEKLHILHTKEISDKERQCCDQTKKVDELQQSLVNLCGLIEKERKVAYNAGLEAGKAEFLKSDEYQNLVAQHRLNGALDAQRFFTKS